MKCLIKNILPPCSYRTEGIESISLLDIKHFKGLRFDGDSVYSTCRVSSIYRTEDFFRVATPDSAKYSSTFQNGTYTHTLETFVGDLSSETLSALHNATKGRYIVLLELRSGRRVCFGYDTGATVVYNNTTSEGLGSAVTITATTEFPLFEVVSTEPSYETEFIPDFELNSYCESGYKQATIAYKVAKFSNESLDINGEPIRESGKKQAIALLNGFSNPKPEYYDVELKFDRGGIITGNSTISYNTPNCPIGFIRVNKNSILLSSSNHEEVITISFGNSWAITEKPSNLIFVDLQKGEAGIFDITVERNRLQEGQGEIIFTDLITGEAIAVHVINSYALTWILSTGYWRNMGIWMDESEWKK